MKSSWTFGDDIDPRFRQFNAEDRAELDGLDKHARRRMTYHDRMKKTLELVHKYFPSPDGIRLGDFGCRQGNFSLRLAEDGYEVYALDMNPVSLEYAKMKYERGKVHWIHAKFSDAQLPRGFLHVVIMTEVITTTAYPDRVVGEVMEFIRPGGLLIATFPNGAAWPLSRTLKTYEEALGRQEIESLHLKEDGYNHLFRLPPEQLKYIVPPGARIVDHGFCGSTWLLNRYSEPFSRVFPASWIEGSVALLSKVPVVNRYIINIQYVVLRKGLPAGERGQGGAEGNGGL